MPPLRLRFERIGIEGRHVIVDLELVQPIEVMQHEARAKADCAPFLQVSVDFGGASSKSRGRLK